MIDAKALKELADAIRNGSNTTREKIVGALLQGAARIEELQKSNKLLRYHAARSFWEQSFNDAMNAWVSDPTLECDVDSTAEKMLDNCEELANKALARWYKRWPYTSNPETKADVARNEQLIKERRERVRRKADAPSEPGSVVPNEQVKNDIDEMFAKDDEIAREKIRERVRGITERAAEPSATPGAAAAVGPGVTAAPAAEAGGNDGGS